MRHTLTHAASLLLLLSLPFASCKQEAGQQASQQETSQQQSAFTRPVKVSLGTPKDSAIVNIVFPDYPDAALNLAITEHFSEQLGATYEGDYADCDSFARHYANRYMADMKEMHSGGFEDPDFDPVYSREVTITKGYETDRFVTFDIQTYEYDGGVHGGGAAYGMTFRKSDGRYIDENVLNTGNDPLEWNEILKKGLMEYFEVSTEEDLESCLMDVDLYCIPMPSCGISFTEQGLSIIYQQYEIAAYAMGRPNFVIPYEKLKPFLNVTGRRLLAE